MGVNLPSLRTAPRRRLAAVGSVLVLSWLLAACTGGGASPGRPTGSATGVPREGGTATFAEAPGTAPNYIFPMDSLAYFNTSNINEFQYLMWRPLYWFGDGDKIVLNEDLSLAEPPKYSAGNTVVDITLKPGNWSDGKPITSRDVTFWINMLRANSADYGQYVPGFFPDDVKKVATPSDTEIVLTLDAPVNPTWFTFNELSQITPMPQHAWDKTSADGPIGDHDLKAASAKDVYKFLDGQARKLQSYADDPLWQVVDGPWKLSEFRPDGYAEFVPNTAYSGTDKPHLAKFVEQPFTSAAAEFNALRAGQITYGYIPQTSMGQAKALTALGYTVDPWYLWSMNILPINYNNPKVGKVFSQLYIRQAMQSLINQPQYISAILHGNGAPDNGPVPTKPDSLYLGAAGRTPQYPYDPKHATELLTANGWTVTPGGVTTCTSPGTGAGHCGEGIAAGQKLSFDLVYSSGVPEVDQEMRAFKSALSQAGIELNLSQAPSNDIFGVITPCKPSDASCGWQMAYWGTGWQFAPDFYPSGEVAFSTGAVGNWGSYSDKTMDAKVAATTTDSDPAAFTDWEAYTAEQVPMLFMPTEANQVSAIKSDLGGAIPQPSAGLSLTPEKWYFTEQG
ncbi:peptide ABC transporter substrate-binding protein [Microbispora bryophytorum]|uniref:peptide ABC transporter substrate-binding protein n=1 Tax=Microbispora bryophytorum TaxID=1460882 RepID=UPI0037202CC7